jgi:predicted ArsR family transcriptional regulator
MFSQICTETRNQEPIQSTTTLALLQSKYPVTVSLKDAAREIGISHQTLANQISSGRCLLATSKEGSRRVVHIKDLAEYIDRRVKEVAADVARRAPKRGRPAKIVQIARRSMKGGV